MKSHTEYLTLNIPSQMAFRNITPQVEEAIRQSGVEEGLVLVNSMHITASVFINDDERGLHHDFGKWLEELAPFNPSPDVYHHNRTGEDNADAHLKRQIMGREVVVADHEGATGLRPVGADLLRRVRRAAAQAGAGQGHRGVRTVSPRKPAIVTVPAASFLAPPRQAAGWVRRRSYRDRGRYPRASGRRRTKRHPGRAYPGEGATKNGSRDRGS